MTEPTTTTIVTSTPSRDYIVALVRTAVGMIVGAGLTWLIKRGVSIPSGFTTQITEAGVGVVYYAGVHALERFKSSKFGWLLGIAKAPIYPTGSQTTITPEAK